MFDLVRNDLYGGVEQSEGDNKSRALKVLQAHNAGLTRELGSVDMSLMQALEDNGLTLDSIKLQNTPISRRISRRRYLREEVRLEERIDSWSVRVGGKSRDEFTLLCQTRIGLRTHVALWRARTWVNHGWDRRRTASQGS